MPATTKKTTKKKTDAEVVDEIAASTAEVASGDVNANKKPDVVEQPLSGDDEIRVISLVPYRVAYDDKATFDKYVWEGVGDIQYITVDTLVRMRRNHPDYFNNVEIKPEDGRVIKKLNLTGVYDKYEKLTDADNYSRENVSQTIEEVKKLNSNAKLIVVQKIKGMVDSGEITDINVIRTIERRLGIDIIALL